LKWRNTTNPKKKLGLGLCTRERREKTTEDGELVIVSIMKVLRLSLVSQIVKRGNKKKKA